MRSLELIIANNSGQTLPLNQTQTKYQGNYA